MAQILKASRVIRVPLAAVVNPEAIISHSTTSQQVGDPWVDIGPGAEIDSTKWPESRTVLSRVKGKAPETIVGLGKKTLDSLRERGALVPGAAELPPDPARQRTVPDSDIFDEKGRARTVEIKKPDDPPERPKKAKKGGK